MTIEDFIEDPEIVDALVDSGNRLIMVIGGSDTGKTTLIELLADFLSRKAKVGLVDLDMGQSHIGPPTTIAWGKIFGGFGGWSEIAVEDFFFAGSVTPFGNLIPAIVGAKLITDRALSSVKKVIVDTTGLIADPAGCVLKQNKIDILCPDIVLALERSGELGHILDAFRFHRVPRIYRLRTPAEIKTKSVSKRAEYRFRKIRGYLARSRVIEIPLAEAGMRFIGHPLHFRPSKLKNRIVSFRDKKNRDFALGVIAGTNMKDDKIPIRTPDENAGKASSIIIGKTELDMTNSQLRDATS